METYFDMRECGIALMELAVSEYNAGHVVRAASLRKQGMRVLRVARVMYMRGGLQYCGR
jgi:hypothetical protein